MDPELMFSLQDPALKALGIKLLEPLFQLCNHCISFKTDEYECRPSKTAYIKGGDDPLRYIYVFKNKGQPSEGISRHWHYLGLGLSDIYGYSAYRLLEEEARERNLDYATSFKTLREMYPKQLPGQGPMNGFGFELTFRVKCDSEEEWAQSPPEWPQRIMQNLARYVFKTMNIFRVDDHVAWYSPLDSDETNNSPDSTRIQHILMTLDPQFTVCNTVQGPVQFIQIVGACEEELQAARQWNVKGILEMMREREETGGPFLLTDLRRCESVFELNPENDERLVAGIKENGSDMAQISARHKTSAKIPNWFTSAQRGAQPVDNVDVQDFDNEILDYPVRTPSRMSLGSESELKIENAALVEARYYDNHYILLGYESAKILPVMLEGRLAHKRAFSFQSFRGDSLVTFLPEGGPHESLVGPQHRFVRHGHWLQIYVCDALRQQMYDSVKEDFSQNSRKTEIRWTPKNYSWPEFNLHLTVVDVIRDD